jgi:hypothetical protein
MQSPPSLLFPTIAYLGYAGEGASISINATRWPPSSTDRGSSKMCDTTQKTTVRHERNVKTSEESYVSRDAKTAFSLGASARFSREGLRHGSSVSSIHLLSPSNTRSALPGLS